MSMEMILQALPVLIPLSLLWKVFTLFAIFKGYSWWRLQSKLKALRRFGVRLGGSSHFHGELEAICSRLQIPITPQGLILRCYAQGASGEEVWMELLVPDDGSRLHGRTGPRGRLFQEMCTFFRTCPVVAAQSEAQA